MTLSPNHHLPSSIRVALMLLVVAVPLIAVALFGGVYSWAWGSLSCILFAAVSALAVYVAARKIDMPADRVLIPGIAIVLFPIVQYSLGWTVSRGRTLTDIVQLLAAGCVMALSLVAFTSSRNVGRAGRILWWFSGALCSEAILQRFAFGDRIYGFHDASYASPVGPYVYHNHFAGCLDLLFPLSVAVALRGGSEEGYRTSVRMIFPGLILAAMILSGSRGGLLTILMEATLAATWTLMTGMQVRRLLKLSGSFGAAAMLVFLLVRFGPVASRFSELDHHDTSLINRLDADRACVSIFMSHKWAGTGLGTFAEVYPRYESTRTVGDWLYAHDVFAQELSEGGVIGFGLCVWFLLFYSIDAIRAIKAAPSNRRLIKSAAFIGTVGLLFHSVADFQFHAPANLFLFALLAGLASARTSERYKATRSTSTETDKWVADGARRSGAVGR